MTHYLMSLEKVTFKFIGYFRYHAYTYKSCKGKNVIFNVKVSKNSFFDKEKKKFQFLKSITLFLMRKNYLYLYALFSLFFNISFSSVSIRLYRSASLSANTSFTAKADILSLAEAPASKLPIAWFFENPSCISFYSKLFFNFIYSTLFSFLILAISFRWVSFRMAWASPKKSSIKRAHCSLPLEISIIFARYCSTNGKIWAGTDSSEMYT